MFGVNWKNIGLGLAKVASGASSAGATVAVTAAKAAVWASNHPEVLNAVATVAGHPEVGTLVTGVIAEARATAGSGK